MVMAAGIVKPRMWCPGLTGRLPELERNLRLFIPLWESGGNHAMNLAADRHPGVIEVATWNHQVLGPCLEFAAAADGRVGFGTNYCNFFGAIDFTVWAYVRQTGAGICRAISRWDDGGGSKGYMLIDINGTLSFRVESDINSAEYAGWSADSLWHTIAGRKLDKELRIFSDGISQGTDTMGSATITERVGENLRVGGWRHSSQTWRGDIAAAGIWDRALLASEILLLEADPWCLIRPRLRTYFSPAVQGGVVAGPVIPVFMSSYRRRRN